MKYYIVIIDGGSDISLDGPHDTIAARDVAARDIWKDIHKEDGSNLFRLTVDDEGALLVGVFLEGDFD